METYHEFEAEVPTDQHAEAIKHRSSEYCSQPSNVIDLQTQLQSCYSILEQIREKPECRSDEEECMESNIDQKELERITNAVRDGRLQEIINEVFEIREASETVDAQAGAVDAPEELPVDMPEETPDETLDISEVASILESVEEPVIQQVEHLKDARFFHTPRDEKTHAVVFETKSDNRIFSDLDNVSMNSSAYDAQSRRTDDDQNPAADQPVLPNRSLKMVLYTPEESRRTATSDVDSTKFSCSESLYSETYDTYNFSCASLTKTHCTPTVKNAEWDIHDEPSGLLSWFCCHSVAGTCGDDVKLLENTNPVRR